MATTIWTGTTDGDFTDDTNWSGSSPANTNTVLFRDGASNGCTSALQTGSNGETYPKLSISRGYTYDFGASGAANYLDATLTELSCEWGGNGTAYFDGAITNGVIDCYGSGLVKCQSDLTSGDLSIRAGRVQFESAADLESADIRICPRAGASTPPRVTIDSGATTTTSTITVGGGELVSAQALVNLLIYGGVVKVTGTATIATVRMYGGTLLWDSSGTITTAYVGGNATLATTEYLREKTLTTLYMDHDGIVDLRAGGDHVTVTNCWISGANSPMLSPGAKIAI